MPYKRARKSQYAGKAQASQKKSWYQLNRQNDKPWQPKRWKGFPTVARCNAAPGLSTQVRARLHFNDEYTISAGSGSLQNKYFRANGAWDPDTTVGGTSAAPLHIWQEQYNRMVTEVSRITVTPMEWDGAFTYGVYLNDDVNTIYNSAKEFIQNEKGDHAYISKNQQVAKRAKCIFYARQFFDIKDVSEDDIYSSTTSAIPLNGAFFNIWVQPILSETVKVTFKVDIWYDNKFMKRKDTPV